MNKLYIIIKLRELAKEEGRHLPLEKARILADDFERRCEPVWEHPYKTKLPALNQKQAETVS